MLRGASLEHWTTKQLSRKLALWSLRELSFTIHFGSNRDLGQNSTQDLSGPFSIVKGGGPPVPPHK